MKQPNKAMTAGLWAATSLTLLASTSRAVTYAESGDAGQTLATATTTTLPAGASLTSITGTFGSVNDADLFKFSITAPTTFSATTVNAFTDAGGQDTALFLFNASGVAIATNDDSSGTSLDAALPAGNALYASLAAGTYYLGISESGNEAVNSASQLLFAGYPSGDTTAVRGAATGVNPTTEATFDSNSFGGGTGSYEIDLTSSAAAASLPVPEPATWATLVLGTLTAAASTLLRKRSVA